MAKQLVAPEVPLLPELPLAEELLVAIPRLVAAALEVDEAALPVVIDAPELAIAEDPVPWEEVAPRLLEAAIEAEVGPVPELAAAVAEAPTVEAAAPFAVVDARVPPEAPATVFEVALAWAPPVAADEAEVNAVTDFGAWKLHPATEKKRAAGMNRCALVIKDPPPRGV